MRRSGVDVVVRRRRWRGSRVTRSAQGSSWPSDPSRWCGLELRARTADQRGTRIKGSERTLEIGLTGGGDVIRDSGAGKGPGSGSKLGELPGLGAKLLRGSAEAGARRSGEGAAAQGTRCGGAEWGGG